jgi:hypothetical protein
VSASMSIVNRSQFSGGSTPRSDFNQTRKPDSSSASVVSTALPLTLTSASPTSATPLRERRRTGS